MTEKTIYAALAKAQAKIGRALKSETNPHFKSKYADLGAVMDACMEALTEQGIAVFHTMRTDDGTSYVVTVFALGDDQRIECPVPLMLGKADMQGVGSAITYARRYGLMCLAGVAADDDDGNAAAQFPQKNAPAPRPAPAPKPVSDEQLAEIETLLDRAAVPTAEFLQAFGMASDARLPDFPAASYQSGVKKLKATIAKREAEKKPDLATELQDEVPY